MCEEEDWVLAMFYGDGRIGVSRDPELIRRALSDPWGVRPEKPIEVTTVWINRRNIMREVSVDEYIKWCEDNPIDGEPYPHPGEDELREMAARGVTFEIRGEDEGEYPHINSEHHVKHLS